MNISWMMITLFVASSVLAEPSKTLYQWTDERGIHLSDTPVEGAKEIHMPSSVPGYQTPPPILPAANTQLDAATKAKEKAVAPMSISWVAPTPNQIVWSNLGDFVMRVKVLNLPNDFHFALTLNDQEVQPQSSGSTNELELSYQWTGLVVGEYKLRLKVLNSQNQILADSGDRAFYVRRTLNRALK
jgi:hypothetical protein